MDDDAKIAYVTLFCMFVLALAAAFKGGFVNPVAVAAPAYMFLLRIILGATCPVFNCSLVITAVSMLALVFYIL